MTETVDGRTLSFITARDNALEIASVKDGKLLNPDNVSVYFSNEQYICELKRTDAYDRFNIEETYWIYKIL